MCVHRTQRGFSHTQRRTRAEPRVRDTHAGTSPCPGRSHVRDASVNLHYFRWRHPGARSVLMLLSISLKRRETNQRAPGGRRQQPARGQGRRRGGAWGRGPALPVHVRPAALRRGCAGGPLSCVLFSPRAPTAAQGSPLRDGRHSVPRNSPRKVLPPGPQIAAVFGDCTKGNAGFQRCEPPRTYESDSKDASRHASGSEARGRRPLG